MRCAEKVRDARSAAVQREHLLTRGVAEIKKRALGANVVRPQLSPLDLCKRVLNSICTGIFTIFNQLHNFLYVGHPFTPAFTM
jgi:hypothetical protein